MPSPFEEIYTKIGEMIRLAQAIANSGRETAPDAVLSNTAQLVNSSEDVLQSAVLYARSNGASWSTIGNALGISKQSAHERFRAIESRHV